MNSRGLRNNNPLNIRHGHSQWQGRAEAQTDREFVCFMTMGMGYRAAWKTLQTYYETFTKAGKIFCLYQIIHRWAPPEDNNDTSAYLHQVIKLTGRAGMQPLPEPKTAEGYRVLQPIIVAMTCVENGIKPAEVPVAAIEQGWKLAFPDAKMQKCKDANSTATP